jgi:hypothetical protein
MSRQHNSVKVGLKTGRRERHMRIKRRAQLESLGRSCEVPEAKQAPFLAPFICHCKFIARDMERRAFPPVCGLHLDETLPSVCIETGNIIARAIPVFFGNPADLLRQVLPPRCSQRVALVLQDALSPRPCQGRGCVRPARPRRTFLAMWSICSSSSGGGWLVNVGAGPTHENQLRRLGHAEEIFDSLDDARRKLVAST